MVEHGAASRPAPSRPKVRLTQPRWVSHQGRPYLYLEPPFGLAENGVLVPQALTPLLALADGTRDAGELRAALSRRTGIDLGPSEMDEVLARLDRALIIENGAYAGAAARAVREYRRLPHREPSHAGPVYPPGRDALADVMRGYERGIAAGTPPPAPAGRLVGVVSPHIDYARGWATYARLWSRASAHLEDVELALVFGTDHAGGLGALTPTRQNYATPFGALPTDTRLIDGLAQAIGTQAAYQEEIHHLGEHSIELASVWMHHYMGGRACPTAPILCGSFHGFVNGGGNPADAPRLNAALEYLAEAAAGRRTLVVAAGDLAHVGPAFGDPNAVDVGGRDTLRREDAASIQAVIDGDAAAFFAISERERDQRKLCGLPPIYMMLRFLELAGGGPVRGEAMGYDQCPADAEGGSLVSIVGALLYNDAD